MIPGNREHSHKETVTVEKQNNSITFFDEKNYKECLQEVRRMSRGCPEDIQRMPEGIQRGPKDLQRIDWGCIDNAYIGMSRNHNDSDLRCCCADR